VAQTTAPASAAAAPVAPTAAAQAQAAAPAGPPLRAAYVAPVAAMAPLWLAKESGAFDREGVSVEVRYIQANAAVPALLAGEVDLLQISAPGMIPPVLQGADLAFIAGALNQMIFSVHAAPDVRTPQDLRGKLFGSDRPGTPVAFATELALGRMGLRSGEVQVLNVGSTDQLLAALLSGQLAGTVLNPPANFAAEDAGYHQLIDLYDVPYQNVGIVARRSQLDALAASLIPFLRAYRTGIDSYHDDRALALKVIEQYTQESNPAILDKTYEFYRRIGFNRGLTVSEVGLASILQFLGETLPAAKDARPTDFFDLRFVQQLS
jgi:ABC-type nitrate/sulfonate/bicarbonate transport system substrate-binding protein